MPAEVCMRSFCLSPLLLCHSDGSTLYCWTVQARREGGALQEESLERQLDSQSQALQRGHALLHPGRPWPLSSNPSVLLQPSAVFHCFIHCCVGFVQASGQQVPVIVQSCICFINLHGKYSVRPKGTFRHCYLCLATSERSFRIHRFKPCGCV